MKIEKNKNYKIVTNFIFEPDMIWCKIHEIETDSIIASEVGKRKKYRFYKKNICVMPDNFEYDKNLFWDIQDNVKKGIYGSFDPKIKKVFMSNYKDQVLEF